MVSLDPGVMLGVDPNQTKGIRPQMTTTTGSVAEQAHVLPETAAAFTDFIRQQARMALMQVIEQKVAALCGRRYHPAEESACHRSGSVSGTGFADGRPEAGRNPRVRRRAPGEKTPSQTERWPASGLTLASKGFRKITGHSELEALVEALLKILLARM